MLSDWYFCCCIKSSPENTSAFLSILETLSNAESDGNLLLFSYNELQRTEIWMQIYAIPYVLDSLHHENYQDELQESVKRYFEGLIDFLPEVVSKEFRDIVNSFLISPRTFEKNLTRCLKVIQDLSDCRSILTTPYLDLKEFLPEVLLLAMVADKLKYGEKLGKMSSIEPLLEDAVNYEFGRLAFRLAAYVALIMEYISKEKILSLIWKPESTAAGFEPDLMLTYAKVFFLDNLFESDDDEKSAIAKNIVKESLLFTRLRRFLEKNPEQKTSCEIALNRIGLKPERDFVKSLPIVYWQSTLWSLATQVDPLATAAELQNYWSPLVEGIQDIQIPPVHISRSENYGWQEQLRSLLSRHRRRQRLVVRGSKDQEQRLYIPEQARWLLFSPWLARASKKVRDREGLSYVGASDPILFIRLIAGALTSIELLQQLPQNNSSRTLFAALVVHAADVLALHKNELKSNPQDDASKPRRLSLPIAGLALFSATHQIRLAGCGYFDSIPPSTFIEILRLSDAGAENPTYGDRFLKLIVPKNLVSWIADAYPGAVGKNSPARWLNYVNEIYEYFERSLHIYQSARYNLLPALLVRFFSTDYKRRLKLERFDWRVQDRR